MLKKIVSILVVVLLLGVIGAVTAQPGRVSAATAASNIGVVDYGLLLDQHPETKNANEALKAEAEQAKQEFESKSANLSDQEKHELDLQLGQRFEGKRRELLGAIIDKINAAVKAVADEKKLTIVVNKNAVVYGGQDITNDVQKKITGK